MSRKELIIELVREMGQVCPDCGKFFVGAAISATTEKGNYGIYFDEVDPYPLSCGKCPECAIGCFRNLSEYVRENGIAPCVLERKAYKKLDNESISTYIVKLKEQYYVECYPYTYDFQLQNLQYGTGEIPGGTLMDLTSILLDKFADVNRGELIKWGDEKQNEN